MGTFIIANFFKDINPTISAKLIYEFTTYSVINDDFVLLFLKRLGDGDYSVFKFLILIRFLLNLIVVNY